jgi:2-keto-4-pentenoate hydratase
MHTQDVAVLLRSASESGEPCPPVRELGGLTIDDAYVIQEIVMSGLASERNPRIGRKVGLTSPAVQRQLGVDRPDFGVLLADMRIDDDGLIPFGRLLQPRIEAEIAFVLADDVDDAHPDAVARAVANAMTLRKNGEVVSQGTGADCLGSPLNALVWVAGTALTLGRPLRAGEVVLSGALGPMVPVAPGDVFEADIPALGSVTVSAEAATPTRKDS